MAQVAATAQRSTSRSPRREGLAAPFGSWQPPAVMVRNLRLAYALRALPAIVAIAGIALLTIGAVAIGAILIVIGIAVFGSNLYVGSSRRLLRQFTGREADSVRDARYVNVVDGLCVANGLRRPHLLIITDDAPNAIVLGRSSQAAVMICTTGMLALLDRIELEGAVAQCLAHIKLGNEVRARTATTSIGAIVAIFSNSARLLGRLAGLYAIAYADQAAVGMTRYPPGLIAALEKLAEARSTRPSGLTPLTERLTASMWLVPLNEAWPKSTVAGVLDLDLRMAELREL